MIYRSLTFPRDILSHIKTIVCLSSAAVEIRGSSVGQQFHMEKREQRPKTCFHSVNLTRYNVQFHLHPYSQIASPVFRLPVGDT